MFVSQGFFFQVAIAFCEYKVLFHQDKNNNHTHSILFLQILKKLNLLKTISKRI